MDLLMPLLSVRMRSFAEGDRRILPLFEAYEQVICSIGAELCGPHISEIYVRVVSILQTIRRDTQQVEQANLKDVWYFATDFFIRCVDLLHAIANTMKNNLNLLFVQDGYLVI